MELFTFGFDAQSAPAANSNSTTTPTATLKAEVIKVLWCSWCDAVIASQNNTGLWTVDYSGTGLTAAQQGHIFHSENIRDTFSKDERKVSFFGSTMHHGLRGYVISSEDASATMNLIVIFATHLELEEGLAEIQSYPVHGDYKMIDIKVTSNGELLLSATNRLTKEEKIVLVPSVAELRSRLASQTPIYFMALPPLAYFTPLQWEVNATTSTILDPDGKVYTSTRDPRYPKCLGRPYDGTSTFEPVPYLSETSVTKVASDGYMSAAVSSDGELFLWGQAGPGLGNGLKVLDGDGLSDYHDSEAGSRRTGVWVEGEQDESVKCMTVHIEGEEAKVYDIAVGHGHVLVAAEVSRHEGGRKCAVFAAGDNSRGQLGLGTKGDFVENFEEVRSMRGKWIEQLVAAGWCSFGVVDER
ncbi:Nn.00g092540.m01.CDS01 [Neocucurbitaria sp. VM-36]